MVLSRRIAVWLLVSALVAAQALGLMHRIVHAPHAGSVPVVAVAAGQGHHGAGWVADLFAGHDESSCRLFDPLTHDGPPSVPALVLPLLLSSYFLDVFQGEFLVRWAALYDARGPPPLR
ncbi:hypothetical protein [uncultured Ramlibacter sp.]|uniref:hypothetical protein n=1 Tax=uncultured Ramlibacter sp. TaxID=260755 RepID=UPI002635753A|nr:hypothetical protein [uncultured Ramlibacter sp.]